MGFHLAQWNYCTGGPAECQPLFTPHAEFHGMDTFTYTVSDGHGGSASANVTVQVRNLVDVAGRVFDDSDNDGAYEPDNGDVGIGGVIVQLFNRISGG
jgi:hypothetical protein